VLLTQKLINKHTAELNFLNKGAITRLAYMVSQ